MEDLDISALLSCTLALLGLGDDPLSAFVCDGFGWMILAWSRLDVSAFSLFFLLGVFDGARSEPRVGFMFARENVEINQNVKLM